VKVVKDLGNVWLLALLLVIVLTCSNLLYQALFGQEWGKALERSYFQAVAVFIFAWWLT